MEQKQRFTNKDRLDIADLYESIEQSKGLDVNKVISESVEYNTDEFAEQMNESNCVVDQVIQEDVKVAPYEAKQTFSNEDRIDIGCLYESIYTPEKVIKEEYGDDKVLLNPEEWMQFLNELKVLGFELKGDFGQGRAPYAEYYKYNQYTIQVRANNCTPSKTGDLICDGFVTELYFDNERLTYRDDTIPSDTLESLKKNTMKVIKEMGFDVESEFFSTED